MAREFKIINVPYGTSTVEIEVAKDVPAGSLQSWTFRLRRDKHFTEDLAIRHVSGVLDIPEDDLRCRAVRHSWCDDEFVYLQLIV